MISKELKINRGWFYKGKIKYFCRNCNFCNEWYEGQGLLYCSYRCSRLAKPIIKKGNDNPSKRQGVRDKISLAKKGIPPSTETIKAVINAHKGFLGKDARNGRWKEDRTTLKKTNRRGDPAYVEWRITVYRRDGFKCKLSSESCLGRLEAHHIKPWRNYPELRYEINNGITLCHAHHPSVEAEEKRLEDLFLSLISSSE